MCFCQIVLTYGTAFQSFHFPFFTLLQFSFRVTLYSTFLFTSATPLYIQFFLCLFILFLPCSLFPCNLFVITIPKPPTLFRSYFILCRLQTELLSYYRISCLISSHVPLFVSSKITSP